MKRFIFICFDFTSKVPWAYLSSQPARVRGSLGLVNGMFQNYFIRYHTLNSHTNSVVYRHF